MSNSRFCASMICARHGWHMPTWLCRVGRAAQSRKRSLCGIASGGSGVFCRPLGGKERHELVRVE
jgi:hypothetical protein